jgi:hypothetical protein
MLPKQIVGHQLGRFQARWYSKRFLCLPETPVKMAMEAMHVVVTLTREE